MFNEGDKVRVRDDFDGDIILHGWKEATIENYTFTVATYDDYRAVHPNFAQLVKKGPSKQGEVFLKWKDQIFVLSPARSLERIEVPICNCPINRLWAGSGHQNSCPEFPAN